MKNLKFITFTLFLIVSSCKGQVNNEPSFEMSAENEVNIKVNSNVKNALEDLSKSSINITSSCSANKEREYTIDFYFHINQKTKELIIIEYFSNPCEQSKINVNRKIQKSTIPIQKIKYVDIEDFFNTYVDKSNKNMRQLFITMEYNTKSIVTEYSESRGDDFDSQTIKENSISLEIPKDIAAKLKADIDLLVKEFK